MSILEKIIAHKEKELKRVQSRIPLEQLETAVREFPILNFHNSLTQPGIQVIAEVKRKSPSAGNIYISAKPVDVALSYEKNGAAAISVLTDEKFFGGSLEMLRQIKAQVSIPVLRKDFIISEYQVYESYTAGADAILLIADALSFSRIKSLYELAKRLGLAVLMEMYSEDKLKFISSLKPRIVGVNARNLETMQTDLGWCAGFFRNLPENSVKVAESGVNNKKDLHFISEIGYDAALIGTALMKTDSPGKTLKRLLNGIRS